jgi:hypothetical protein
MRVLVCGGRDLDWATAWNKLEAGLEAEIEGKPSVIIHGGAKGADEGAARWAKDAHIPARCYPADWKKHGKAAGPIRNQRMLDEGKPDVVVALPGGKGTADMVRRAHAAGVRVRHL